LAPVEQPSPGGPAGPGGPGNGPGGPGDPGRPARAPGEGRRDRAPGGRFAIAVAFVAVIVAVAALGVAVTALARANGKTQTVAASQTPAAVPPAAPSGQTPPPDTSVPASTAADTSVPSAAATSGPGSDEDVPVPETEPQLAYQEHELRIQPAGSCSDRRSVDLDEPRVGADQARSEFSYGTCSGTVAQLDFADGLGLADVPSPTATGLDCLRRIRDAPINEPLTPVAGLTLCITTNRDEAAQEGNPRRVVRMAIRSVAGDGTIVVRVTAWNLAP
jgi:hypothetical protein